MNARFSMQWRIESEFATIKELEVRQSLRATLERELNVRFIGAGSGASTMDLMVDAPASVTPNTLKRFFKTNAPSLNVNIKRVSARNVGPLPPIDKGDCLEITCADGSLRRAVVLEHTTRPTFNGVRQTGTDGRFSTLLGSLAPSSTWKKRRYRHLTWLGGTPKPASTSRARPTRESGLRIEFKP